MKLKNKILSLILSCILFTNVGNKKTNSEFLTTIGCVGAFFTVVSFASFLASTLDKDKDNEKFKEKAKNVIERITFTIGMFALNYLIDKYVDNKKT